jgi:hypothetical protein
MIQIWFPPDATYSVLGDIPAIYSTLRFFGEPVPSDCSQPDPGDVICLYQNVPTNWILSAPDVNGVFTLTCNEELSMTATEAATIQCFRFWDGWNVECLMQGTVTVTGGGGDMTFDNVTLNAGDTLLVNSLSFTLSFAVGT